MAATKSPSTHMENSMAFQLNIDQWPDYDGYFPLRAGEIRLIDIEAGDLLVCSMRTVNLKDPPNYHALSYYWGAPVVSSALKPINFEGVQVMIRPSIYSFLWNLITRFQRLTVWLDVLCINQKNSDERNKQVSLMGEIFSSAAGVYLWLGDGDSSSDYAFDFIGYKIGFSSQILRECFEQLISRPYWKRVWVIQEFALAKDILICCGSKSASWEEFQLFLEQNHCPELENWSRYRQFAAYRKSKFTKTQTIIELMLEFESARCTDPRDKAYGMLNLARDGPRLTVDYGISMADLLFQLISLHPPVFKAYTLKDRFAETDCASLHYGKLLMPCLGLSEQDLIEASARKTSDNLYHWLEKVSVVESVTDLTRSQYCLPYPNFALHNFTAKLAIKPMKPYVPSKVAYNWPENIDNLHGTTNSQPGDFVYALGRKNKRLCDIFIVLRPGCSHPIDVATNSLKGQTFIDWGNAGVTPEDIQLLRRACTGGMQVAQTPAGEQEMEESILVDIARPLYVMLWILASGRSLSLISKLQSTIDILGGAKPCSCFKRKKATSNSKRGPKRLNIVWNNTQCDKNRERHELQISWSLNTRKRRRSEDAVFDGGNLGGTTLTRPESTCHPFLVEIPDLWDWTGETSIVFGSGPEAITASKAMSLHINKRVDEWLTANQKISFHVWLKLIGQLEIPKTRIMSRYRWVTGESLPNSSYPRVKGNLSASSTAIWVDEGHQLHVQLPRADGNYQASTLNLDAILTNRNGQFHWVGVHFVYLENLYAYVPGPDMAPNDDYWPHIVGKKVGVRWYRRAWSSCFPIAIDSGNFSSSARNVRLLEKGRVLQAELRQRSGKWRKSQIDLDEAVYCEDGELRYLPLFLSDPWSWVTADKWLNGDGNPQSLYR